MLFRSCLVPSFVLLACAVGVSVQACSGDDDASVQNGVDASAPTKADGSTPGGDDDDDLDAGRGKDASPVTDADPGDACATGPTAPLLNGPGHCGTFDFGAAKVAFTAVVGDDNDYDGGALPAGIYDAVVAERGTPKGSWRETFVVDGAGKFTRIRQIDTGTSDASVGPVSRRSGTYVVTGSDIKFTYDCAYNNDAAIDAGSDTLPFEIENDSCGRPSYKYGVTGIRITLKQR